jgi:hypothetical protein
MKKYIFGFLNAIITIFILSIFRLEGFIVGWISASVYWITIVYYEKKEKNVYKDKDLLD